MNTITLTHDRSTERHRSSIVVYTYINSTTMSMGIEPTSLINTKATNNDRDPTNYVISITVSMGIEPMSMCIEPTAPHTGSTQLYATVVV